MRFIMTLQSGAVLTDHHINAPIDTALISGGPFAVHNRLNEFEIKYDLLEIKLDGWCIWPVLKFPMSQVLNGYKTSGISLRKAEKLKIAFHDLPSLINPSKSDYVIHTEAGGLVERRKGKLRDIWADELIENLGDCFKLETVNVGDYSIRQANASIKSHMTISMFSFFEKAAKRFIPNKEIEDASIKLLSLISREFCDGPFDFSWIRSWVSSFYWNKKFFKWFFSRIQPKVYLTRAFARPSIIAAAKELSIPTIECQHGLLNGAHSSYAWGDNAAAYRSHMPIPDYLFLYGEYWKKELSTSSFWGDSLRVVGNPRFDQYKREAIERSRDCITILVTAQKRHTEPLIDFLIRFLGEMEKNRTGVRLLIKIHPRYHTDSRLFFKAFESYRNVDILGPESPASTFELFAQADLHASVYSTCHYESLAFGVPTLIIPLSGYENVLHLAESGHATLLSCPERMAQAVEQSSQEKVPPHVGEYYFICNALDNMLGELEKITH